LSVAKVFVVVTARFEVLADELIKNQASWEEKPPKDFGFLVFINISILKFE
jgi:hypothetical protein